MRICSACLQHKDGDGFSRKQWRNKQSIRRCLACIERGVKSIMMTGDILMLLDLPHNVRGKVSEFMVGNGGNSTFLLGALAGIEAAADHLGESVDGIWKSDTLASLMQKNYGFITEGDLIKEHLREMEEQLRAMRRKVEKYKAKNGGKKEIINRLEFRNHQLDTRNKHLETSNIEMKDTLKYLEACNTKMKETLMRHQFKQFMPPPPYMRGWIHQG